MAHVLLALLADLVFESAASRPRAFRREMDRYLEERGFVQPPPKDKARAR